MTGVMSWTWKEQEITVEYEVYKGSPGSKHYPPEPGGVDIIRVTWTKSGFELSDSEYDEFEIEEREAITKNISE